MNRIMKDSGVEWIGEIPEHWKISTLGRVATLYTGNSIKDEEKTLFENPENAIPYISTKDITAFNGLTSYDNGLYIPKDNNNFKKAFEGNILICIEGGSAGKKKTQLSQNVAFVNKLCCISSKSINNRYLYLYTLGKNFEDYFQTQLTGIIGGVSINNLKKFSIPIPSLHEQQKIADFLDEKTSQIDIIIDKTKQSIVELKKYKQALITEIVTKGLNPDVKMKYSGIEWIGEIPEQWNVSRLRYLGTLQNGISKSGDAFGSGFPFLSYGDVYRGIELPKTVTGLIESSASDRLNYSVTYGDVLFTRTSETIEEVGFSSTCLETIPDVVFAGFVIRFRPITDELSPNFSKYYFRSQIHRSFFAKEMNLVTRASLSQQLLKKLPVLLPSTKEQQQIAGYLDEKCAHIDNLIADKEKLLSEFETYKKALIFEYVTGKKEVE